MFIRPAKPGLIVRDPQTKQRLPAEGKEVPPLTYWFRRLRDGDVLEGPPPITNTKPPTKPAKKEDE